MKNIDKLQKGDILYNENGETFYFDSVYNSSKILVFSFYESYDGEESISEHPLLLDATSLHNQPPEILVNSLVKNAKAEIKKLKDEEKVLRSMVIAQLDIVKQVCEDTKRYSGFNNLRLIMDKKITHVVKSLEIMTFDEAFLDSDKKYKLLSLNYNDGELIWEVNNYADGSGGNTPITLCRSYEDAIQQLQYLVNNRWDKWLINFESYNQEFFKLRKIAKEHDLDISEKIKQHYEICDKLTKEKSINNTKIAIELKNKDLQDLQDHLEKMLDI